MRGIRWLPLLCALVASAASGEERPLLVVMDLQAKGASALQAQAATQAVVRGLRELDVFQVLSSDDVRQLLAIERGRELIGAGSKDGAVGVGKALGAKQVVTGAVSVAGSAITVDVNLLDTQKAQVTSHRAFGPVRSMEQVAHALPGVAQELVGPLLMAQQGSLLVRTREEGAEVVVDGTLRGSTPLGEAVKLPRGLHRLEVRKDGFITRAVQVRIEPDQVAVQDVTLVPSPDYAEAWKSRYGRLRTGAIIASGVTVGALAGAFFLHQHVSSTYDQQFRPRQLFLQAEAGGSQSKPGAVASDPVASQVWDACVGHLADCQAQAQDYQSSLKLQQGITYGLVGLGIVSAGTAAYLWLSGKDPNRYSGLVAGVTVGGGSGTGFALSGSF